MGWSIIYHFSVILVLMYTHAHVPPQTNALAHVSIKSLRFPTLRFHHRVYSCLSFPRTIRRGSTCGNWRLSLGNVTLPTRAMTAAGKCMPVNTLCHTLLTLCRLLWRRLPMTRTAGRMQTCKVSQRGSAYSDHREVEDSRSFRKDERSGEKEKGMVALYSKKTHLQRIMWFL